MKKLAYLEIAIEVCCYLTVLATADENIIAATTLLVVVLVGLVIGLSEVADDKLQFLTKSNALITSALAVIAAIC